MSRAIAFLLFAPTASYAFALTSAERDKQVQTWNEMIKGWSDAKDIWEKDLSNRGREIKDLRDKTDIEARQNAIKEKAQSILSKAPKGIAESLSGNTKKAALTAIKMAKDFVDQKKAEGEIVDIIYDDSKNAEKLAALEKSTGDLEKSIEVANDAIKFAQERVAELMTTETTLELPQWISNALAKAAQAQKRVDDRRENERKQREKPKPPKEPGDGPTKPPGPGPAPGPAPGPDPGPDVPDPGGLNPGPLG